MWCDLTASNNSFFNVSASPSPSDCARPHGQNVVATRRTNIDFTEFDPLNVEVGLTHGYRLPAIGSRSKSFLKLSFV